MFKRFSYFKPTLGQSLMIVILFAVVGSAISVILSFILPKDADYSKLVHYILIFVPIFIYLYYQSGKAIRKGELSGTPAKSVKVNKPCFGSINPVLFFIILLIATPTISVLMDPLLSLIKSPEWFNKLMEEAVAGDSFIISLLTVTVCAPLLEEYVCRGTILRGLLQHTSPVKAILLSAFIFGFIHLNPWQAIPGFVMGCFIGWIYYKTNSIWAAIFIHFVHNSISTWTYHFFPEFDIDASLKDIIASPETYWLIFSVAFGILALTIFIFTKYIRSPKIDKVIDEETIPA